MALPARRPQRALRDLAVSLFVPATVGGLALAGGGYSPVVWGLAGLGLLWLLAVGLVLVTRVQLGALEVLTLVSLTGLLAWTGLSVLWSLDVAQSVVEVQRGLVTLAGLAVLLLFARRAAAVAVLGGLAGACTLASLVAVAGWASAGAPSGRGISEPVGYANALGLLAAMGLIVALGFVTRASARAGGRLLAGGAAVLLGTTLYLSASRGALAALGLGLGASLFLAGGRRRAVATSMAGVAVAAALVVLAAGIITPTRAPSDVPAWKTAAAGDAGAASVSVEPRLRFWAVAWRSAGDAPLIGTGAGTFARRWLERRPLPSPARNVHNLYLETLAELGIVGLALLLATLVAPLVAAARVRSHPLAPAAIGAYAAFLVHAGVDADWEMPVLPVAALMCGGALLIMGRPPDVGRRVVPAARAGAIAAVLALAAFVYMGVMGNVALERSHEVARVGALEAASVHARAALHWSPWSGEPWGVLAEAALARGNEELARARFARGLHRDQRSWLLWKGLARARHGAARREAARRAAALNPLGRR
jgi:O-antigen ligase